MDEAWVVLVADAEDKICQAFPFATKAGAERASEWFKDVAYFSSVVIDDHEAE